MDRDLRAPMGGVKRGNARHTSPIDRDIRRRSFRISHWFGADRRNDHDGAGGMVSWLRINQPAAIVFITGLSLTLIAFEATRDLYRSVVEQEFDRQASHYILALKKATDRHVELMGAAANIFEYSSAGTGRLDLYEFARDRLAYYPGYEALAWAPVVPQSETEAYVRRAEAEGLRGFGFTEITGTGVVVEALTAARRRGSRSTVPASAESLCAGRGTRIFVRLKRSLRPRPVIFRP